MTIHIKLDSITNPISGFSVIVNASNAIGVMGAGVAGAISRAGGPAIQDEAMLYCRRFNPDVGSVFMTMPGELNCDRVYHAITMKLPGTSYRGSVKRGLEAVEACMRGIMAMFIIKDGSPFYEGRIADYNKIAIPALGTGIGGLPTLDVARVMVKVALEYGALYSKQEIIFCDIDEQFLRDCKQAFKELTSTNKEVTNEKN